MDKLKIGLAATAFVFGISATTPTLACGRPKEICLWIVACVNDPAYKGPIVKGINSGDGQAINVDTADCVRHSLRIRERPDWNVVAAGCGSSQELVFYGRRALMPGNPNENCSRAF